VPDVERGTYQGCYVCGMDNAGGLRIPFRKDPGGGSRADYVARSEHAGWPDIIHGGLLFTLMDEAVAWACSYSGLRCVTAKAEARFRAPVRVGMALVITGHVTVARSRALRARAEIRNGSDTGELIAELDAMMAITNRERASQENPSVERA
jgi:acyl-coenzyme A thioesterase PaaI-like protein